MGNETQGQPDEQKMAEAIKQEKIRRSMLAGPYSITCEATVAEMDRDGNLTVLRPGTNDWVCIPGDQNIIGAVDMCLDPMGMVWMKDLMARKAIRCEDRRAWQRHARRRRDGHVRRHALRPSAHLRLAVGRQ